MYWLLSIAIIYKLTYKFIIKRARLKSTSSRQSSLFPNYVSAFLSVTVCGGSCSLRLSGEDTVRLCTTRCSCLSNPGQRWPMGRAKSGPVREHLHHRNWQMLWRGLSRCHRACLHKNVTGNALTMPVKLGCRARITYTGKGIKESTFPECSKTLLSSFSEKKNHSIDEWVRFWPNGAF